jgi:sensor histidine kinase YesM
MNRHFIFNALNSIQYFINTQDKLSANKYLTKFAQLIRKNLDSSASGENLVPLSEEIQRLELYLTLEAMRFEGRFKYTFEIDPEIELEEIRIPPMLFQPFVENAIIHGILPLEQLAGEIAFKAELLNENFIEFTITDNGVGYSKSLKEKNSIPYGLALAEPKNICIV